MKTRTCVLSSLALGLSLILSTQASAATILVDENGAGIGTLSQGFLSNDPGPGGLNGVLTYVLPFAGVQGDVLLVDPGNLLGDVIRFNGNGTLLFYSDIVLGDVKDNLADTPSPPLTLYANQVSLNEVGPNNNANGASYTPLLGQPGFDASLPSYIFVSDGGLPEPSSITLLGLGALGFVVAFRRRLRLSTKSA
jgi:hypothetical protein